MDKKLIAVAQITKLYGAEGQVALNLFDTFPEELDLEEPLFVYCDKLVVPLFLNSFRAKGATKAVVSFDDVDTNLRISEFIGSKLYSTNFYSDEDTSEDEEYEIFFEDLVDYTMYDLNSGRKGKVLEYLDYKNNPIFVVNLEGIEVMVPACDDIIQDIYPDALVVEALIPEGLFEFYKK